MADDDDAVVMTQGVKETSEESTKMREMTSGIDVPQDYSFSTAIAIDAATATAATIKNSAHAWVSPNKSDEEPSSEESSPSSSNLKFNEKELTESSIPADLNAGDIDFETPESEENCNLDLSIIGQRLEVQKLAGIKCKEGVLETTSKNFVKIIHGDKEVMLVLPSEVSPTFHL